MRMLFINLPPFVPKKPNNALYSLQASMNLGMLSVASAAERAGHSVAAYDWLGPQQFPLVERLPGILADFRPDLVGFSIPSGYAEPYLKVFAPIVKHVFPDVPIVVGGQYHVGFRGREILQSVPEVDAVALGSGETLDWGAIEDAESTATSSGLLRRNTVDKGSKLSVRELEPLRWNLYGLALRDYAPSIEIGRGCPFTCSFCSLSGAPERMTRSDMGSISEQLAFWVDYWSELDRIPIYAECPVFFCNSRNFESYEAAFGPHAERLEWRVQARVDSIEPDVFHRLHGLGLRIIDLGLESASPRMLRMMNKTRTPERYLEQAASFIEGASAAGIKVKLNILLYPGETRSSARETEDFVTRYRDQLAGIAAGSTIEFPGAVLGDELPELYKRYGTKRVHDETLASAGIYPLDLSHDFSFEAAREWCLQLSQQVMTARKYYDLKRIGYFPPSLTFETFMDYARLCSPHQVPFAFDDNANEGVGTESIAERVVSWDKMR